METPEQYNLSWKNFRECTTSTFRDLLSVQEFSDVTLVCDDDKQVFAHKVILSACSPFFRRILLNNPHQHPLIYLTGVSKHFLTSMVAFMYLGQTNVAQEDLTGFMAAASKFQIKGLSEEKETGDRRTAAKSPQVVDPQVFLPFPVGSKPVKMEDDFVDDCEVGEEEEGYEGPVEPGGLLEEPQSLEDLTPRTKWNIVPIMDERGKWGIFGDDADYESFRKDDNMYACDHCHFSTKNKSNLKAHRNAKHLGVKYPCDQCDYKASYSNHLRQHKRVKHEGVNFPCELCLFTTSQKSKLKLHLREKHGASQDLNQKQVSLSLESPASSNIHRAIIASGSDEDRTGFVPSLKSLQAQLSDLPAPHITMSPITATTSPSSFFSPVVNSTPTSSSAQQSALNPSASSGFSPPAPFQSPLSAKVTP